MFPRRPTFIATLLAIVCVPLSANEVTAPNQDAEAGRTLLRIFTPDEYDGSEKIVSVAQATDGAIYVATVEGVSRYDGSNWNFTPSPVIPVSSLRALADNTILIRSRDKRVARLHYDLRSGVEITSLENSAEPQTDDALPQAVYPNDAGALSYPMKSGLTAQATARGGVSVPLPNGLMWQINSLRGLSGRSVTCLLEDRDGGLWIGTDFGISRADLSSPVTLYLRRDGLERSPIRAITRINEQLIVAQNRGVYRMLPANTEERSVAKFEPIPNIWIQPADLHTTADENLMIVSLVGDNTGLHILHGDTSKIETLSTQPFHRLLPVPGSPDVLALGRGIIGRLHPSSSGWKLNTAQCDWVLPGITTAWDKSGALWLGDDSKGFARLTASASGWPHCMVKPMPIHRLHQPVTINRLTQNREAPLFFTESGLHHFQDDTGEYIADPRSKPWNTKTIVPLTGLVQPDGRLWVQLRSQDKPRGSRLVRVSSVGDPEVSLPGNALEAIDFSGEGRLFHDTLHGRSSMWISGSSGLLRCDLAGLDAPYEPPPKPLVRLIDAPSSDIDNPDLHFTAYHGSMHFIYSVPDYRTGANWTFQTRLSTDDEWSPASTRPETLLQALPSGSYTWSVRAINELGLPGPPCEIAFVLRDPWHRTWQAYALYLIVAAGVVMGFVQWRLAGSRREQRRLESLVQERTVAWQEAAARAETASQAKTAFLANASHELRTPLNAILGYAQLLESNAQLPANSHKPVSTIRQSGEHLLRLINHVLDLAKLESGVTNGSPETITLRPFVEEIAVAHQIAAQNKGLKLTVEISTAAPVHVTVDSLRLRQVLDNLIGNAVKFTETGSIRVAVTTDVAPETLLDASPATRYHRLKFMIRDTGPGIGEADLQKIFEPFQQTATGVAEGRGTGLGLALARRMVELMGGQLVVNSQLGTGTAFEFELALADSPSHKSATPVARKTGYTGPRKHLLVVDDEEFNRHLLRDLLTPLGFDIDLASSAAELFARLTINKPDAIIMDLRMPGMDGMEAIHRLRLDHTSADLKIIAHSASIDATTRTGLDQVGCDAFLPKPFHETELHDILARILEFEWSLEDSETS